MGGGPDLRDNDRGSAAGSTAPGVEELQSVIAGGLEQGFVTAESVAAAMEDADLSRREAQEIVGYLEEQGVEVVARPESSELPGAGLDAPGGESLGEGRDLDGGGEPVEPLTSSGESRRSFVEVRRDEVDLTVEPSLDSLRLYLRSIGRVPLLNAEQEIALAKRIERGDMAAKQHMV